MSAEPAVRSTQPMMLERSQIQVAPRFRTSSLPPADEAAPMSTSSATIDRPVSITSDRSGEYTSHLASSRPSAR